MKHTLTFTLVAAVGLILQTTSVSAQAVCGKRDAVVDRLSSHFGETRRGMGLGSNNGIIEVFASEDTGTWTITVTMPDGRMCLMASGESYEDSLDTLPVNSKGA